MRKWYGEYHVHKLAQCLPQPLSQYNVNRPCVLLVRTWPLAGPHALIFDNSHKGVGKISEATGPKAQAKREELCSFNGDRGWPLPTS